MISVSRYISNTFEYIYRHGSPYKILSKQNIGNVFYVQIIKSNKDNCTALL